MAPHIPDEILNHIMCYLVPVLPHKRNRPDRYNPSLRPIDLSSHCLVSQKFRQIAQPLLYHTINMANETTMVRTQGGPSHLEWPGLLLRTIVNNPHLAKYIRILALVDMIFLREYPSVGFPWDVPHSIRCALEPEIASPSYNMVPIALLLYATMVEKLLLFECDPDGIQVQWIVTCWRPQENSILDIEGEFGPDLALERGPFANYDLPCLKEFHVDAIDSFHLFMPLLDYLKRPGLSIFHLNHGRSVKNIVVPQPLKTSLSGLHVLKLKNSYIESHSLENILKSFPMLRVLSVHVPEAKWAEEIFRSSDTDVPWTMDLQHIGQALRDYGRNLVNLSLDLSNFKLSRSTTGRIGSLCSMPSLRHLKCYRDDLIAQDWLVDGVQEQNTLPLESVLPPSITTLSINYVEHDNRLLPPRSVISAEIESILSSTRLKCLTKVRVLGHTLDLDELILCRTKMLVWSFDFKRTLFRVQEDKFIETTPCNVQDGFIDCISLNRLE